MKFQLIDAILEQTSDRIVAVKNVSAAEEYLADHFPSFPILPGVLMIEAMVQAARVMIESERLGSERFVLGTVKALKYGAMVRPGDALIVEVTGTQNDDGAFACRGVGRVRRARRDRQSGEKPDEDETAVSGRFTMRTVRI